MNTQFVAPTNDRRHDDQRPGPLAGVTVKTALTQGTIAVSLLASAALTLAAGHRWGW